MGWQFCCGLVEIGLMTNQKMFSENDGDSLMNKHTNGIYCDPVHTVCGNVCRIGVPKCCYNVCKCGCDNDCNCYS
ncbi:hypothetical protein R6Q59_036080 [Mikania micrantha]